MIKIWILKIIEEIIMEKLYIQVIIYIVINRKLLLDKNAKWMENIYIAKFFLCEAEIIF